MRSPPPPTDDPDEGHVRRLAWTVILMGAAWEAWFLLPSIGLWVAPLLLVAWYAWIGHPLTIHERKSPAFAWRFAWNARIADRSRTRVPWRRPQP